MLYLSIKDSKRSFKTSNYLQPRTETRHLGLQIWDRFRNMVTRILGELVFRHFLWTGFSEHVPDPIQQVPELRSIRMNRICYGKGLSLIGWSFWRRPENRPVRYEHRKGHGLVQIHQIRHFGELHVLDQKDVCLRTRYSKERLMETCLKWVDTIRTQKDHIRLPYREQATLVTERAFWSIWWSSCHHLLRIVLIRCCYCA